MIAIIASSDLLVNKLFLSCPIDKDVINKQKKKNLPHLNSSTGFNWQNFHKIIINV